MSESVGEIHVDVHADATGLTSEVERAAERASRNAQIEMDAELTQGAIRHLQRQAAAAAARANATVEFDADTDFASVIRDARRVARLARQRVEFEAHLSTQGIVWSDGLRRFIHDADGAEVSAHELDQALQGLGGTVGGLGRRFGGVGQVISNSVTAFAARAVTQIAAFGILIGSIIPYVIALAASLASVVGAAITAAGSLVSVGVALGTIAGAYATVIIGTNGLSEAFKAQDKALKELETTGKVSKKTQEELAASMDRLSPSAREFVDSVNDLRDAWSALQRTVQQNLFLDIGSSLERTAKVVLPILREGFGTLATQLNNGAIALLAWSRSADGLETISGIFTVMEGVLPHLIGALGSFAKGIANLFIGAGPAAVRFSALIERVAKSFEEWTARISADGSLDRFLTRAHLALIAIGDLAKSAGKFILALLDPGGVSDNGVALIERMSAALDELTTWLNDPANQPTIQEFWDQVNENLDRLVKLVTETDWGQVMRDLQGLADALWWLARALQFLADVGAFTNAFSVINLLKDTDWGAVWAGIQTIEVPDWLTILTAVLAPIPFTIGVILGTFAEPIGAAFNAFFTGVDPPDWLSILTGVLAPIPFTIGLVLGGEGPAVQAAFDNMFANLDPPDWLTIMTAIMAPVPVAIGVALGGQAGAFGAALTAFFEPSPGIVSGVVAAIIGPFGGLATRILAPAGDWGASLTGWFSGSNGIAIATALNIISPFGGLAVRIIGNAGSIYDAFVGWFSGLGRLAQSAADAILAPFRGLGAAITSAIGNIDVPSPAAKGLIAGAANGIQVTRGPQLRLVGEAGPEAIVPLRRTQILDPAVNGFLKGIAADRWGTPKAKDGGTIAPQINLTMPTDDPEAAAMAVWNRLVFEGVV